MNKVVDERSSAGLGLEGGLRYRSDGESLRHPGKTGTNCPSFDFAAEHERVTRLYLMMRGNSYPVDTESVGKTIPAWLKDPAHCIDLITGEELDVRGWVDYSFLYEGPFYKPTPWGEGQLEKVRRDFEEGRAKALREILLRSVDDAKPNF